MAEASDAPVLALSGVTRDFGTTVITKVLRGIDLVIRRGELAALMGPSGSGKSTLLNIMGLLDRPTTGSVVVEGIDTTLLDDAGVTRVRGETLGFVFQFHHLLPAFSAVENVMMPLMVTSGRVTPAMHTRAAELLTLVGLGALLDRRATDLSGGQQQRAAIARALSTKPRLVLADEPTGNLDTESAAKVFELLRRVNRESGVAFLIVTHDRALAARCDRLIEIVDGRIVSDELQTSAS